ncbi:oligosaccharide flippase family protein [Afifella sp. JA880]|uniref:oligosaccharide flippase family protein n=1 Tax=Afifella sp. JA880 TaxID=2975280 RepID=UPI0021BA5060|nr:oligosaccharide flippase family protein [Afifella sp. JA880]MCT8266264.1 oligosaccharide flippase family protein [Afifella sp. JA880]
MALAIKALMGRITGSSLTGGLAAYGASEVVSKLSRLGVVVVLARYMDPLSIGLAAGAIATSDILKSLTENGVGQRIIAARQDELESTCRTAHRIFWVWCLGLFALQLALAGAVSGVSGNWLGFALIAVIAGEYLFMPGGLTQCALAMREGKFKQTAAIAGGQVVAGNILTVLLVLVWPHPLAIVLPRLLTAPIWLIAMRRLRPWRPADVAAAPLRPFVRFGSAVIGIEFLKAVRMQGDKLIVGGLLGADALGIYFFAVNAGLGITTSFSTALSTVLFPYICRSENRDRALGHAFALSMAIIVPVAIAQSLLAPYYVPVLFGAEWADMAPLVAILCLAAIPTVLWSASAQWLRTGGRAGTEFTYSLAIGATVLVSTAVAASFGLTAVAWTVLAAMTASQVVASVPAILAALRASIGFVPTLSAQRC